VQRAQQRLLTALLAAGPVLLALVGAVVWRTARSALSPVDVLTAAAGGVHTGGDARAAVVPDVRGEDEIARLATTLRRMLDRLAESFERERAFVDDASHELRTPVAVIRGELELALTSLDDLEAVEHSLRAALGEAERMGRLSEDLLVLARANAGTITTSMLRVDLCELLASAGLRAGRVTGMAVEVSGPPVVVQADPEAMERVISNLVANAATAGATTVHLVVSEHGSGVDIQVEDDGPGFPPGFATVAFERFRRADVARTRTGGAGLGLSIVRTLVEAQGGHVLADEQRGRLGGAVVRLRLLSH